MFFSFYFGNGIVLTVFLEEGMVLVDYNITKRGRGAHWKIRFLCIGRKQA